MQLQFDDERLIRIPLFTRLNILIITHTHTVLPFVSRSGVLAGVSERVEDRNADVVAHAVGGTRETPSSHHRLHTRQDRTDQYL